MTVKPTAVETLPSLDELLGVDQKAETIALQAAQVQLIAREIDLQMVSNAYGSDEPIPGFQEKRTFGEQRKRSEKAWNDLMRRANEEGVLEKVKELMKPKIDEILKQQEQARNMPPSVSQNGMV